MNKAEQRRAKYQRNLARHIEQLKSIGFIGQFSQLQSIERRGARYAEQYCNGQIDSEEFDKNDSRLEKELAALFVGGVLPAGVFTNSDPRGYYLKFDSEFNTFDTETKSNIISCRDWGGNGILSPDKASLI